MSDQTEVVVAGSGKSGGRAHPYVVPLVGLAILASGLLLPASEGLSRGGLVSLAVLALAVLFWSTEAVNATVTALMVLALLPTLGALTYADAFAGLGQHILWRLVGILTITLGLTKSGLDRRFATALLRLARGNVNAMLVILVVSSEVLVFLVPTPPARAGLLATTYLGILHGLGIRPPSNLGKVIMLGIPIFAVITSASLITGASVEVYSVGLFSTLLHHDFTYISWMLVNLPVTFLICFAMLPVLMRLFPPEMGRIEGAQALIERELRQMGALNVAEKKMIVLFVVMLALWFSGISEVLPAELMLATVLFLPGVEILNWNEAQTKVPWGIVVLYGASLSLAVALQQNGVVTWATQIFLRQIGSPEAPVMALLVIALATVVRLGMTNMTGVVATLFPLTVSLAASMGLNPVWLGMICVIASSMGFFFPSQNICSLITYEFGYYNLKEMVWAGAWTLLVATVGLVLMAMFYWPLVGVPVWGR